MTEIGPEELSALLDGELPPDRAQMVRAAIAARPALAAEWERLTALDARLAGSARASAFAPRVALPEAAPARWPVALALAALLALRIAAKIVAPTPPVIAGQLLLLIGVLAVTIRVIAASEPRAVARA